MIYLDNAATSFPKPECMIDAMSRCLREYCGNPGRSGHQYSIKTGLGVFDARNQLAELFGIEDGSRIIFTSNTTEALNLGIKGVLNPGDHVITTSMEHNSVLRPLNALKSSNIETTIINCDSLGCLDTAAVKKRIKTNTKLIICTHASNVTGTVMPVDEVGKIARESHIMFLLDAAQCAGSRKIKIHDIGCDMMAAPGHKGLMGPQGTGLLYVRDGLTLKPLKEGGTGTESCILKQPLDFPDGYEAGTVNAPGIIGMSKSVKWVIDTGIESIQKHEEELIRLLDNGLRNMEKVRTYGPESAAEKCGISTFNITGMDCEETAEKLAELGIAVRGGFHCAGLAHRTIGTWDLGAVRVSVGPFNNIRDIIYTLDAIYKITKQS